MKIRRLTAVVGSALIFICCLLLYRMADTSLFPQDNAIKEFPANNWVHVQDVESLPALPPVATVASVHEAAPIALQKTEDSVRYKDGVHGGKLIAVRDPFQISRANGLCYPPPNELDVNIQMLDVYKELRFDNPDGGVWKQGWAVTPDLSRWSPQHKLQVFVVPHSHNDPGWVKTFDDYYTSSSRNILNSMLSKLSADPNKKFIWAEISFFSLWWDELSEEDQTRTRRLVENGQLEIVTGGWVMNDEANAHYYSIITQLTEGHQWVKDNLHVTPRNSWCIDPFGKSSTMPYLLKKMGLSNLVIQRVHYSIKKHLAQTKNLEFRWRQLWDTEGDDELLTHLMPFYSYDVPHTCGPDPKVCCQFDFKRLPGHGLSCPWKEPPRPINAKNVAVRAQMLLDQYRKKAELYRTNVILVPLGDDFRYEHATEWDNQFDNYFRLFEYLNSHAELHVDARFGTLEDFFTALLSETTAEEFPSLHGDFFTYADRDDHYWSGYFTSRPFHKRMDRVLMGYLRAAEILYAMAWGSKPSIRADWLLAPQSGFTHQLRDARRALSLFQHHDGVAGTARDHVMEDYARRMLEAIGFAQHVLQQATHFLLTPRDVPYLPNAEQVYFDVDDHRRNQNSLSERKLLIFRVGESKRVVFFNSLARRRQEVVSVHVFSRVISVTDGFGAEVPCQTSPVFLQGSVMDSSRFELSFVADVPPLGLASYTITHRATEAETRENILAKVTLYNSFGALKPSPGFEAASVLEAREFSIESSKLRAVFTDHGQLKSVTIKETDITIPLHIDFVRYVARQGSERSGAYLFLPAGDAVPVRTDSPAVRVLQGPLVSRAELLLPNVRHTVSLYSSPGADQLGLEISNLVDLSKDNNYELAMRITTRVRSMDEFYTDLNGFQMTKRKRFAKLPLQANFYPLPQAMYIEDDVTRVTLVTAQPLGAASLKEGQLEVIQDRRLQQDDNRGLGQGVLDNRPTLNVFRLLVEQRATCKSPPSLLSLAAHESTGSLLNPLVPLIWRPETPCDLASSWAPGEAGLAPDLELIGARTLDVQPVRPRAGLVFHRTHLDTCFLPEPPTPTESSLINVSKLLPDYFGEKLNKSSLSFLTEGSRHSRSEDLALCHMDFLALVIDR